MAIIIFFVILLIIMEQSFVNFTHYEFLSCTYCPQSFPLHCSSAHIAHLQILCTLLLTAQCPLRHFFSIVFKNLQPCPFRNGHTFTSISLGKCNMTHLFLLQTCNIPFLSHLPSLYHISRIAKPIKHLMSSYLTEKNRCFSQ